MNGSTSIFDFIDGALDHVREQELFDELARHPEMRAELRQHIAIGEAVRADREAYVPPAEAEHALMAGLGLAPIASLGGAAGASSGAGVGALGRVGMFKGLAPLVGSFVAGIVIATGGYFAAFSAREAAPVAAGVRDTIFIREMPQASAPVAPSAATTSPELTVAAPSARATAPLRHRAPSMLSQRVETPVLTPVPPTETPSQSPSAVAPDARLAMGSLIEPVQLRLVDRGVVTPIALDTNEASVNLRGLDQNAEAFATLTSTRERSPAFAEVRVLNLTPFVDNDARKARSEIGDEFAAGLYLRASESFTVGAEAGQARYPQTLVFPETYSSNGRPVGQEIARIDQNPSVIWLGISGRQELGSIGSRAPYWVQATLGYGIAQGPMLNARAGVSLEMSRHVSLSGALETSSLVYFFNGQPLYTGKYGFSVGVQLGM